MVAVFIDESGKFTPESLFNVVAAISLPHKSTGRARRELLRVSQDWPRVGSEIKGGQLTATQLAALVDVLMRHQTLLHCVGVRIVQADLATIERHKQTQCEGITRHLTDRHGKEMHDWLWGLRRRLEPMSLQLYTQSVAQTELLAKLIEDIPNFFAQRRPAELGRFEWFIDAKDKKITPQESWWRDTLAPLMSSRSRELPAGRVRFPGFDYSHFDRAYGLKSSLAVGEEPRPEYGADVQKLITSQLSFIDSKSDILIQAVDVLCSFLRRALNGTITAPDVINSLGRLQLMRRDRGALQSVGLVAFAKELPASPQLAATVRAMTSAGRAMVVPNRWKMMDDGDEQNGVRRDIAPRRKPIPIVSDKR